MGEEGKEILYRVARKNWESVTDSTEAKNAFE